MNEPILHYAALAQNMYEVAKELKHFYYQTYYRIPQLNDNNIPAITELKIGGHRVWVFNPRHEKYIIDEVEKLGLEPKKFDWYEHIKHNKIPMGIVDDYKVVKI